MAKEEGAVVDSIVEKPKNKVAAFLLCLFLGFTGAHLFYAGKVRKGILYLFTLGLLDIGPLIDLFIILFGKFPEYDAISVILELLGSFLGDLVTSIEDVSSYPSSSSRSSSPSSSYSSRGERPKSIKYYCEYCGTSS